MTVREMTIDDYDAVMAFWRDQKGIGLSQSDSREQIAQFLARNAGLSIVATKAGRIVASVLCGHDGRRAMLYHVAVEADHRLGGVGRKVVGMCLEKLQAAGIQKCNIVVIGGNEGGIEFWRKLGFVRRGDLVFMQKGLTRAM